MQRVPPPQTNPQEIGPWSLAGRFFAGFPWAAGVMVGCIAWLLRSHVFAGDGDQIARFTESGFWMVQSELLSQFNFQVVYRILHPWGWDGLATIQLVTCIAAGLATWAFIACMRMICGVDPLWGLALLFSTGFTILAAGHTEYYTQFWVGLILYGWSGAAYLRNRLHVAWVGCAFSLCMLLHMGILFALPSVLLLPWLRGTIRDYKPLLLALIPTALAFLFKQYSDVVGIRVQGLSPTTNFVPVFEDTLGSRFYFLFEWGHLLDIVYAFSARSWIVLPFVLLSAGWFGWRSLLRTDRLFLLTYGLCFTTFSLIWHPNLGIHQDWDLFSLDTVPYLLLAVTYLPDWVQRPPLRLALATITMASLLVQMSHVSDHARFGYREYGQASVHLTTPADSTITWNGKLKPFTGIPLREGTHTTKIIDRTHRQVFDFYTVVIPDTHTEVRIDNHGIPDSR